MSDQEQKDQESCSGCAMQEEDESKWLEEFKETAGKGLSLYQALEKLSRQAVVLRDWMRDVAAQGVPPELLARLDLRIRYTTMVTEDGEEHEGTSELTISEMVIPMGLVTSMLRGLSLFAIGSIKTLSREMRSLERVVAVVKEGMGKSFQSN